MKGWIIFKHAALMLWDNRNAVIRLTAVPFIAIILSAIVLFALQLVINLASVIPIFGFALSTFVSFVLGMLNASILTTLYGHYIENRNL